MTLRDLYEKATGEWRVERVHNLWVEIRTGYGLNNKMIADCLKEDHAALIVAAHNCTEELLHVAEYSDSLLSTAQHVYLPGRIRRKLDDLDAALAALREKEGRL